MVHGCHTVYGSPSTRDQSFLKVFRSPKTFGFNEKGRSDTFTLREELKIKKGKGKFQSKILYVIR